VCGLKKKKTCVKCGVEFDKTERGRVKISLKVEKGERHVWFCKECSKDLIKLLENFVRGAKHG